MFRGAYTALITPFRGGRIDDEALTRLVEQQIEAGIHGLVPCGTTGESPTLSHAEHVHVVEVVMHAAKDRVPVLAGAGSNSTREAIELSRACKELGVAGTLQITPYYNKPPQAGLIRHFTEIADAVKLPIVLYNVPGRTGVDMSADTVVELSKHPNVRGIKEATGDMHRAAQIRERCGDDFDLLSGDDFTLLPFLSVGGNGVISVVSNVDAAVMANLCTAVADGRLDEARALHQKQLRLCEVLFTESNPIPVKAAMAMLGRCDAEIRSPLRALPSDGEAHRRLVTALREHGVLK